MSYGVHVLVSTISLISGLQILWRLEESAVNCASEGFGAFAKRVCLINLGLLL